MAVPGLISKCQVTPAYYGLVIVFILKKKEKEVNVNEKNGLVELSNDTSRVEFHSLRLKRKKDEWRPDLRLQRLHLTSNSKRSTKKIDRPSH